MVMSLPLLVLIRKVVFVEELIWLRTPVTRPEIKPRIPLVLTPISRCRAVIQGPAFSRDQYPARYSWRMRK